VPESAGEFDAVPRRVRPHPELRSRIVPGSGDSPEAQAGQGKTGACATAMGWAQRLKRVFAIKIERCERCGGGMKIIAAIENAEVIEKILRHVPPERRWTFKQRPALRQAATPGKRHSRVPRQT
jgi:hypothetical protein